MKLPRRTLAYVWAKRTLAINQPTWMPWVHAVVAAAMWLISISYRGMNGGFVVAIVVFAVLAIDSWRLRGIREVVADYERTIDELRNRKDTR